MSDSKDDRIRKLFWDKLAPALAPGLLQHPMVAQQLGALGITIPPALVSELLTELSPVAPAAAPAALPAIGGIPQGYGYMEYANGQLGKLSDADFRALFDALAKNRALAPVMSGVLDLMAVALDKAQQNGG